MAAIDEGDGGGFGDVADIDAGETDIAEGLGIDPLLDDILEPEIVLVEVVGAEDGPLGAGGLDGRLDAEFAAKVREVGGFIGLVDGEIDQALDAAETGAVHAEDAFVGFAGANQIEQEQAVEAFESGANGLHVAEVAANCLDAGG